MTSPDGYIITRKRKKYKFACFMQLDNCYEANELTPAVRDKFANKSQLIIELGAGSGEFICEQSKLFPEKKFVAVDVKADRLYTGAQLAKAQGITNIMFLRAHAAQLLEIFQPDSIDEMWLTFPDPFPKKRHIKRRLTHGEFLQMYRKLLKNDGILHVKTDNYQLFTWTLERFVEQKFQIQHLAFDLHASTLPNSYKVMTAYEKRYVAQGLPIYCVDCVA